jgi:DNA-binding transcriptional LysR family regulator
MVMLTAPNIDPELLRAFQLIAEGQSFTQAAEQLGRTQSAVSMQIKRLASRFLAAARAAASC